MTREEHIEFCKICHNRKYNAKLGLVCKLTDQIADFENNCESFEKDSEEEQSIFQKKMIYAGDTNYGDPTNFKKNKQNGFAFAFLGTLVFLISLTAGGILVIIPVGVIIYGISVYYKGMEQEKIWLANEEKKKADQVDETAD